MLVFVFVRIVLHAYVPKFCVCLVTVFSCPLVILWLTDELSHARLDCKQSVNKARGPVVFEKKTKNDQALWGCADRTVGSN